VRYLTGEDRALLASILLCAIVLGRQGKYAEAVDILVGLHLDPQSLRSWSGIAKPKKIAKNQELLQTLFDILQ
jgi:hypothetical protein